jgi:predicted transcriptional regulator
MKLLTPVDRENNSRIIKFLRSHPLISVNGLEKHIGVSQGTIANAVKSKGDKPIIPPKHMPAVYETLKYYGFRGYSKEDEI